MLVSLCFHNKDFCKLSSENGDCWSRPSSYRNIFLLLLLPNTDVASTQVEDYVWIIRLYPWKHNRNIFYRWFVLREWISQSNLASKAKSEMWKVIRNSSQAKHINNSMFTEDLLRRHHYSVTLKTVILICSYHDSCLIIDIITCKDPFSCLIIDIITCKDQRENVPIIDR